MKSFCGMFLCVAIVLAGCDEKGLSPLQSKVGKSCYVQFRRDALGASAPTGIGPNVHEYSGSPVYIAGTLKKVHSDWIVLTATDPLNSSGKAEFMIPVHSILLLNFTVEPVATR